MVVHGEDSLNEGTEGEGLVPPGTGGKESVDSEPTREQMIATGELGPDEAETEEEVPEEVEPGTEVVTVAETKKAAAEESLSIRKEVEKRLMAGSTRDELIAEGYNKNTVRTVASEVKAKLGTHKQIGKPAVTHASGMPVMAKGVAPEILIEAIEVPDVSNGGGFIFEQGIKFGMSLVTLGIRMAQELSGIGVMQAKPLLDMAKSMREGETMAAKNAAGEAAMEAAGMVSSQMMPILNSLSHATPAGQDPMKAMLVRTMEPIVQKMMGGVLGGLLPGGQGVPQITQGAPDGWTHRTEEKTREE